MIERAAPTYQVITLSEVQAACREAYKAKRLIAQMPKGAGQIIGYSKGKYRCAMAAPLNAKVIKYFQKHNIVEGAISDGYVKVEDQADMTTIRQIQIAHDTWAYYRHESDKAQFLELIAYEPQTQAPNPR